MACHQVQIPKHLGQLLKLPSRKHGLSDGGGGSLKGSITSKDVRSQSLLKWRRAVNIEFRDLQYFVKEGSRNKGELCVRACVCVCIRMRACWLVEGGGR